MDFESRELYRERIASSRAPLRLHRNRRWRRRRSNWRARPRALQPADPRMQLRRIHVGYYLVDKGFPQLAHRVGFHPPFSFARARLRSRHHGEDFFIGGIQLFTLLFIAAVLFPVLPLIARFARTGLLPSFCCYSRHAGSPSIWSTTPSPPSSIPSRCPSSISARAFPPIAQLWLPFPHCC